MAEIKVYQPDGNSLVYRVRSRYSIRLWSVRHSRLLEWVYKTFAGALLKLHPVWNWIGYGRVERPMVAIEKAVKSVMFDCRMCGQCALSSTGMSCPMNCPKSLRNGPCGGVRANGHCEVEPDMPCVWVQAWQGSRNMREGDAILDVQPAIDQSLRGSSSWLRVTSQAAADRAAADKASTTAGS
ncbi:MAG: methylenetetrahydrofolate reductase C-terminal domain-containing protein [Rhodospirillales bacterium]